MKHGIIRGYFPILFCCCLIMTTACVNEIASENSGSQEGGIPITFSVGIKKSVTRIKDDEFYINDPIGLYALITGNTMADERYIDNLLLTCGEDRYLIPERDVFYPEGDNTLDFIAYHPYNPEGAQEGQATIPVSIHPNQEEASNYSACDFLTASKERIAGSGKSVSLEFKHQLAKVKITLAPKSSKEAETMKEDDPHIIATGFYTQANYDLEAEEFTGLKNAADITPHGEWEVESGKLVGKEFIILPQAINDGQIFQMEWNGRIYTCPIPTLETWEGNKQYEIEINTEESKTNQLNGLLASINGWSDGDELEEVENENGTQALHLSALSFEASNVYRVHLNGKEVAEICKEYLTGDLNSRAITIYPVKDGTTDLENGTVLQLLDTDEEINGGKLQWNLSDNAFSYSEDDLPAVQVIYFAQDGTLHTDSVSQPAGINVVAYTLNDHRNPADIQQYPIVKIGTQYWLRENLRADRYSNGELMEEKFVATGEAGYRIYEGDYFYNGEALEAGSMCPEGWAIPSTNDWESLDEYIDGDVSTLKTGEWGIFAIDADNYDELKVTPVNNKTMLCIKPLGNWSHNTDNPNINVGTLAAFWTWDYEQNEIPEETVFFIGESNEVVKVNTLSDKKTFYKGLSIRLIKK